MAKSYDNKIDKTVDWGGDEKTGGLGVRGSRVQEFIKEQLEHRIGVLYYDTKTNKYLAFADEINKEAYLKDSSLSELLLGTFDAPFNYTASIKLTSSQRVNVLKGETGNRIGFTFDTYNKEGSSVGEGVMCTYTFVRGTTKQEVSVKYDYLETVSFPIDDYLQTGTNIITISIQGLTTFAATSIAVVYTVVDLQLSDSFDISKVIDITDGQLHQLEIPYTASGQGTKEMEWYIDGEAVAYNKDEDEILESTTSRIKYIDVSNLSNGTHFLQFRLYTTIEGEKFYTDIFYRDFFIKAIEDSEDILLGMATVIPDSTGILTSLNSKIYGLNQYEPYTLQFAVYNPKNPSTTPVEIYIANTLEATLNIANNTAESYTYTSYLPGSLNLILKTSNSERAFTGTIGGSSMGISEITSGLTMDFRATGKNNSSKDKDTFTYGSYVGSFTGFSWNNISGWVDNSLCINNGATFSIDWSPLGNNPTNTGRTLEFSFKTTGVSNDDAEVCNITSNDVGLKITASEVILKSRESKSVSTKFKSEENVRIALVINRATGSTNKGLAFIYVNGILSGATKFAATDSFTSDTVFTMSGTDEAEIKLYQIRAYNTALSSDQILNNYILYQNSTEEMQNIYYRNDVTDSTGLILSLEKLEKFLPVMLVTGNIPTLENTKNKKEQITVDVEYYNLQDPTKSFTMKKAAMTPQGTSSMSYPKKNFKLYTKKIEDTKVYDYQGNEIKDKLYAFKDGAQPVKTWCLKADYAESSSTHNTGIARLWNDVMYNASIDGEYKLRTEAQKAALANNYEYDVRTTVDGFPILMFYRLTDTSDIIFIGKYNFNNDKSTEAVFGFTDIPGFDNSRMQCWEVLNNGHHLALFQDVDNFDTEWTDAFESRYPDVGDAADTTDLKAFATWLVGVKDDADRFKTEKWNHLDVYKTAAYYIYLMRFGAVDQTVKNAMFTSEDGDHFFFINYDNDTVNGLRNDSLLIYKPTITRQSLDETYSTTVYAYAGHDSTLWNMLEADSEFMEIVSVVDNALYQAGLKYSNVIDMFNIKQSSKWCEKIYNQDAQYKYIGPYVNDGIDNLYMLQGARTSHRQWWLSRRFNLVDSWYVSGAYKSNVLECKMASAPIGIQFSIKAGYDMNYGYGVNNIVVEKGIELKQGESHTFTTKQVLNIGDPMRIYTANNLESVDLSGFTEYLSTVNVSSVNDSILGTKLKDLILGDGLKINTSLIEIQGLTSAKKLETLNISGYKAITSIDLSEALYLKALYASNSGLSSIALPIGSQSLSTLKLPNTITSLELKNLSNLSYTGVTIDNNGKNLVGITISNTPKCSDFSFIKLLITNATDLKSLYVDNIDWTCSPEELLSLVRDNNFKYSFFGTINITSINQDYLEELIALFGQNSLKKGASLYIKIPECVVLNGKEIIIEGESIQFSLSIFADSQEEEEVIKYSIISGSRTGTSLDSATGLLTTTENGSSDTTLIIQAIWATTKKSLNTTKTITIKKAIYPTATQLSNCLVASSTILENKGQQLIVFCDLTNYPCRIANYTWTLTSEEENYFEIVSQLNNTCTIKLLKEVENVLSATITLTLTTYNNSAITGSIIIFTKNDKIAITKSVNPYAMQAFYKAGLASNENYMTKVECALVTDNDLNKYKGFFYYYSCNNITDFSEIQYFTSLTKIPNFLFYQCKLSSLIIPQNITAIGDSAFDDSYIENITIPDTVTTLGSDCFARTNYLKTLKLPSSIHCIPNACFEGSGLTEINLEYITEFTGSEQFAYWKGKTLPTGIKDIPFGISMFAYSNLTEVDLTNYPNAATSNYIFNSCKYLTKIIFDNNTEKLGLGICQNCTKLSEIYLPKKLNNFRADMFKGCTSNPSIHIDDTADNYSIIDGNLYDKKVTTLVGCFSGGVLTLPVSCTSIEILGSEVLPTNLTEIVFHSNVKRIDYNFYHDKIQKLDMSMCSDTYLPSLFLNECSNLKSLKYPKTVTDKVFSKHCTYCSKLTEIIFPENVVTIGGFSGLTSLTSIELPESITGFYRISNESAANVFYGCLNLKTIYVKSSTAPSALSNYPFFGNSTSSYTGRNTYSTGENILYVPADATGYDTGVWLDPLQNAEKCGFTLSKTL